MTKYEDVVEPLRCCEDTDCFAYEYLHGLYRARIAMREAAEALLTALEAVAPATPDAQRELYGLATIANGAVAAEGAIGTVLDLYLANQPETSQPVESIW